MDGSTISFELPVNYTCSNFKYPTARSAPFVSSMQQLVSILMTASTVSFLLEPVRPVSSLETVSTLLSSALLNNLECEIASTATSQYSAKVNPLSKAVRR